MFDHEKLHVYQLSITFTTWVYRHCYRLRGPDIHIRDQLIRSAQSIPLNIAEGNGRPPSADRVRFFRIALGSTFESAAALDILKASGTLPPSVEDEGKEMLVRTASMLYKLTKRKSSG